MHSTVVLKFGGSSCADNEKLNIVANKIIEFYEQDYNVVVIVSAQGKTTDKLIQEAKELADVPNEREMDVLLSSGEQMSMAKISILLNRLGYQTVSLTGWQAGIYTAGAYQDSKIDYIDTSRIQKELEKHHIVIIAGFQGMNPNMDITTLGRGGSDTTAVAVAAALSADECYIFSDVAGIYSTDPHKVNSAKKLERVSYEEMLEISSEGAKVLHNRCIEIGKKFQIPIIAKSTFRNEEGTIIQNKIEDSTIKSIVKNDAILRIHLTSPQYKSTMVNEIVTFCVTNGILTQNLVNNSTDSLDISFTIKSDKLAKFQNLIETQYPKIEMSYHNVTRIAMIGFGILNNENNLKELMNILAQNNTDIACMEVSESKIAVLLNQTVSDVVLEQLHQKLIS